MKLLKLSLAALAVIGVSTSSFAADTLADAFKDGKLDGTIKAYYFDRDTKSGEQESIFTTGITLDYKTKSFHGFKLGVMFQSASSPFASQEAKTEFTSDMWGSGAQLSNAYLEYSIAKNTLKVGRQSINTPLLRSSGSRVVEEAFEGTTFVSKELPKTQIFATYLNKFQGRTDGDGGIGQFETDKLPEGAYSVMVKTKIIPQTELTAQYLDVKDEYTIMYADGEYKGTINEYGYELAAQYLESELEDGRKSDVLGFKAGVEIGDFSGYVAYSKTSDERSPKLGIGAGIYGIYYTGSTVAASAGVASLRGNEAYAFDAQYKILGAKVGVRYITLEDYLGRETTIPGGFISYKFKGELKGLSAHLAYEQHDYDFKDDTQEMRFRATYSF